MAIRFHFSEKPNAEVRYGILPTHLGSVIVGETAVGVCSVAIAGTEREAYYSLMAMFPHANLTRNDGSAAVQQIRAFLSNDQQQFDLAVDMVATPFQRLVWRELCAIRFGETTTYSTLAARLGRPNAVRAVARACATNPVSLIVPCHRVVRADGNLAGFRWDVSRKRQLLDLEQRD